jgi:AhpD family alkylhydroperoxidase
MEARFLMGKVQPAAYRAMGALDAYVQATGIDKFQQELIRIRSSQINGCAYCVNHHTADALALGAAPQKLFLIDVWREAPNAFSDEEQLILAMTEEITLIHQHGLSDELFNRAIEMFGEEKTAQIMMIIITINAWNRIGVGLKMHPKL